MKTKILLYFLCFLCQVVASAQCAIEPSFSISQQNNIIYPYFTVQELGTLELVEIQYDYGNGSVFIATNFYTIPYEYYQVGTYMVCATIFLDDPVTPEEIDCTTSICNYVDVMCTPEIISLDEVVINSDGTATATFSTPYMTPNTSWSFQYWPGIPVNNPNNSANQITIDFQGSSFAGVWAGAFTENNSTCSTSFMEFIIDNPEIDCELTINATVSNNLVTFDLELFNGENQSTYPYYNYDFGDGNFSSTGDDFNIPITHAYSSIGTFEACITSEAFYEDSCPTSACVTLSIDSLDQGCTAQFEYTAATTGWINTINSSMGYYNEVEWSISNQIISTTNNFSQSTEQPWPLDLTLTVSNSITGCSSTTTQTINPYNETFEICGKMYFDSIDNNWLDEAEDGLPFETIEIWQNQILYETIITDANGLYCVNLPVSENYYTIIPTYNSTPEAPFYPNTATYSGTWSNVSGTLNFGTNFTLGQPDVSVYINGFGNISAANGGAIFATIQNNSDQTITESLNFYVGPDATITSSSLIGNLSNSNHDFQTSLTIQPFETISCYFDLGLPAAVPLGTYEYGTLTYNVPNDIDATDNTSHCTFIVATSYDPNNKLVEPRGEGPNGNIPPDTEWLTYTINFQNTGNSPAINVRLEDTMPAELDLNSIQLLASSHTCTSTIIGNDVKWFFNSIYLPDSASNSEASKGYVSFRIKITPELPLMTAIENTVAIYFDYNEPVITNTAINTLFDEVESTNEMNLSQVIIYPNPCQRHLSFKGMEYISAIRLFDTYGRVVYEAKLYNANQVVLPELPQALYQIEIDAKGGSVRRSLLIKN